MPPPHTGQSKRSTSSPFPATRFTTGSTTSLHLRPHRLHSQPDTTQNMLHLIYLIRCSMSSVPVTGVELSLIHYSSIFHGLRFATGLHVIRVGLRVLQLLWAILVRCAVFLEVRTTSCHYSCRLWNRNYYFMHSIYIHLHATAFACFAYKCITRFA